MIGTKRLHRVVSELHFLSIDELLLLRTELVRLLGDDDPGGAGVREPRRPAPPTGGATLELLPGGGATLDQLPLGGATLELLPTEPDPRLRPRPQ